MNMSQHKGMNSIKIIKLQSYINVPIEIIQHCACISLYTPLLLLRYSSHCSCYLNLCKTRAILYMQLPLISQIHKLQCVCLIFLQFKHMPISQHALCSSNTHISAQLHCHQQCIKNICMHVTLY